MQAPKLRLFQKYKVRMSLSSSAVILIARKNVCKFNCGIDVKVTPAINKLKALSERDFVIYDFH